ncbi:MAG: hypothetical protein OEL80_01380, partial [Desulfuromonadales bacterium]|nr:hypothetical protein [Desulfuromonadales bacterium]
ALSGCSFCKMFNSRDNSKTVGVARQQRHFLCRDKANAAKESWRGAWHVWLDITATSTQKS